MSMQLIMCKLFAELKSADAQVVLICSKCLYLGYMGCYAQNTWPVQKL